VTTAQCRTAGLVVPLRFLHARIRRHRFCTTFVTPAAAGLTNASLPLRRGTKGKVNTFVRVAESAHEPVPSPRLRRTTVLLHWFLDRSCLPAPSLAARVPALNTKYVATAVSASNKKRKIDLGSPSAPS